MTKRTIAEKFYIYAYQNKINNMVYIGQAIDLRQRDQGHITQREIEFDQEMFKFGRTNFDFWTICLAYSIQEADAVERYWIAEMRKQLGRDMVYNVSDGGNTSGMLGRNHTEESKQKMREVATGRYPTEETIEKMRQAKLGRTNKPHSKETIEKMKEAASGRTNSPEAIEKMRKTRKTERTLHIFSIEQEAAIYQEYLQGGVTKKALARKYGCGEKKIYSIIKEYNKSIV